VGSASDRFQVTFGACYTVYGATCFRSPNYPNYYGATQTCTIRANEAVRLSITYFNTEACCDKLYVNGYPYSGTTGPAGVQVAAGGVMTFSTDGSGEAAGFEICGASLPTCQNPERCRSAGRHPSEREWTWWAHTGTHTGGGNALE
jgi:hypothetical protein